MKLSELQKAFSDAVFTTDSTRATPHQINDEIDANAVMTSQDRINIYRNSILSCLIGALNDIYPVCSKLVGEQFFDAMSRIYARQHPSPTPDLADFGEQFADFIADFEHARSLPYLPDVARLEWAWHCAFHASDEPGLDFEALGEVSAEQQTGLIFNLPNSATLLQSNYPTHKIWQTNQEDASSDDVVDLDEGRVNLIVWRSGYDVRIDPVNKSNWPLLVALSKGQTFGEVCEQLPDCGIDELFPQCVQNGWITSFSID